MFDDKTERAQAVAVPIFYGLVEAVAIGIYCVWAWKVGWTKAPADEKLCVVITKSYEINHDNDEIHEHRSDDGGDEEPASSSRDPDQFGDEAVLNAMENTQQQQPPKSLWQRMFGSKDTPEMPRTGDALTTPTKSTKGRVSGDYTAETAPATPNTGHLFDSERTSL